jgi:ribosomal protein S18 acetylase RimI-like enzyme
VQIREYRSGDHLSVRQIFTNGQLDFAIGELFESEVRAYIRKSLSLDLRDIPSHYKNHPGSNFWVAEIAGEVKGMVAIQHTDENTAELRRMSVSGDTRRRGIGKLLLNTADEFCLKYGYGSIFLSTVSHLVAAKKMYEGNGYRLTNQEHYGLLTVEHYVKKLDPT